MTHMCVIKLAIIVSDNGLSPGRRQAIIWTIAGILLIGPVVINFNDISIGVHTFSLKKIHFKMSSGKWRTFCLGLYMIYPKNDAHGIVFFCGLVQSMITHTYQGYFTGTRAYDCPSSSEWTLNGIGKYIGYTHHNWKYNHNKTWPDGVKIVWDLLHVTLFQTVLI